MPTYQVAVHETWIRIVEIDAEDEDEAAEAVLAASPLSRIVSFDLADAEDADVEKWRD